MSILAYERSRRFRHRRRSRDDWMVLEIPLPPWPVECYCSFMRIDDAAAQLEALGNPTRLRVYRALVRAGDSGLPVGALKRRLKIAGSTLSHHLHRLLIVGLVGQERRGTTLICRANYVAMDRLMAFLQEECCADEETVRAA